MNKPRSTKLVIKWDGPYKVRRCKHPSYLLIEVEERDKLRATENKLIDLFPKRSILSPCVHVLSGVFLASLVIMPATSAINPSFHIGKFS